MNITTNRHLSFSEYFNMYTIPQKKNYPNKFTMRVLFVHR